MKWPIDGIHLPGSSEFEDAVELWNGGVDRRPAMVVQPTSAAEVPEAVMYARAHRLPIAVRGGGHDWAGRALVDDGLVIDLSRMWRVDVDPATRIATVAGGATAADVVDAAELYGLVAATGNCGQVGMAGLTLGGGYGPLNGVVGLAADNLVAAQVVLADGRVAITSSEREPDLYWALRGGGGNFGVVTAMRVTPASRRTAASQSTTATVRPPGCTSTTPPSAFASGTSSPRSSRHGNRPTTGHRTGHGLSRSTPTWRHMRSKADTRT